MRPSDLSGRAKSNGAVRIQLNRKLFAAAALFLGVITAVGLSRAVAAGNVAAALIIVVIVGGPCAIYVRGLLRRGPAIIVDSEGIAGFRTPRAIQWSDISDVHLSQRQGLFGAYHRLVFTVRREDQPPIEDSLGLLSSRVPTEIVELSIDQLTMPWSEIVALVQEQIGRNVSTTRETWLSAVRAK
jgi:hypothetical protein